MLIGFPVSLLSQSQKSDPGLLGKCQEMKSSTFEIHV